MDATAPVFLVVVAAVLIAAIWSAAVRSRSSVSGELQRQYAEQAACAVALVVLRPGTALPIAVFLVQFMVIDQPPRLMFLRWPLLSPNYFAAVDRRVHRWNWSPRPRP